MFRLVVSRRTAPRSKRRGLSTTITTTTTASSSSPTADASKAQTLMILSRRAWADHQRRHPSSPSSLSKTKKNKSADEDKPWPRSVQLAGYTAAAMFLPYSFCWFASSHPPTRDALGHVIPNFHDFLRRHFGEDEWNSVSYYDDRHDDDVQPRRQLPDEPTYRERRQQALVEALVQLPVRVRVQIDNDVCVQKTVPGTTRANPRDVLQAVGYEQQAAENNVAVALDFGSTISDDDKADSSSSSSSIGSGTMEGFSQQDSLQEDNASMLNIPSEKDNSSLRLQQKTYTYSLWHYLSPQQVSSTLQEDSSSSSSSSSSSRRKKNGAMSRHEMQISKLRYEIEQLQRDLKDVNCTRNVDDMLQELKEKKAELRSLTWKRRLGLQ